MRKKSIILLLSAVAAANAYAMRPTEPVSSLHRGRELFECGRWSDARHEFMKVRGTLEPSDLRNLETADFYLALCSVELGQDDIETRLRGFMERYGGSIHTNDIRFALASYYCSLDDYESAYDEFAEVDYSLLNNVQRQKYDFSMGYIEFLNGNYDNAYPYFSRVEQSSTYYDSAVYYMAYIEYTRGNYTTSKRLFTYLLDTPSYASLASYYLVQIEYNEGNYPYVVREGAELAAKSTPAQRLELQRLMSESYFRMNNYRKAAEMMRAYGDGGGDMGREENYILGYSLYRTVNYREASARLQDVCGADDALTQNASYHLADCYLKLGDKQMAARAFAMAANEEYDAAIAEDALFNYGKLQYELGGGTFNEAINVLTRYVDKYSAGERVDEARELLVAAYFNSRNYEGAYKAIKNIESPDNNIRAALQKITYFRALEAYAQGDLERAQPLFEESTAIGISPKYSALGIFWLGEIAYGEGDYKSAAEKYSRYIDRAPQSEREYKMALYNLGYAHFLSNEMKEANRNFSSFLSLYPQNDRYRADALNRRGDTEYAQNRYSAAVESYAAAERIGTVEKYYSQYQRAMVLGLSGRTDRKIDLLKSIISADKGDYVDDATYELGRTYITREEYASGASILSSFVDKYPNSPYNTSALLDLGLAHLNLGDNDRSLEYYRRVVDKDPNASEAKEALRGIREIYVNKGDVGGYFKYAERTGVEVDLSNMVRDSLTFESARKIYVAGKPAEAVKPLENYIAEFPKGYYTDDALFYLSDCYLVNGDKEKAVKSLKTLSERPSGQYTQRVLERLSKTAAETGDNLTAAVAYRRLYDVAGSSQERNAAAAGYVRAVRASGDESEIMAMADDVAKMNDAGARASREAAYAKATILRSQARDDEALAIYRTLSGDVRDVEGAESAYRVIEHEYKAGRTAEAERLVYAFSDGNTPHAYWLGRSFLLLGDIYRARNDLFQARATYQSIVDGYSVANDGLIDEAKERIRNLN